MQKIKYIVKIRFNCDELTPVPRKSRNYIIKTKWGIKICCLPRVLPGCLHTEKVREPMFEKYFKTLLVSNS